LDLNFINAECSDDDKETISDKNYIEKPNQDDDLANKNASQEIKEESGEVDLIVDLYDQTNLSEKNVNNLLKKDI